MSDLNRKMAELMGWEQIDFVNSPSATFRVVDKLIEKGYYFSLKTIDGRWRAVFFCGKKDIATTVFADKHTLAICAAAEIVMGAERAADAG